MDTTPHPERAAIPDSSPALDRMLVEKTEEAIVDGRERWCRDPRRRIDEFAFDLKRPYALTNRAFG